MNLDLYIIWGVSQICSTICYCTDKRGSAVLYGACSISLMLYMVFKGY